MNRFLFPLLFLASSSWTLLGDVLFSLPFEHSVLPERAMGDRNADIRGTPEYTAGIRGSGIRIHSGNRTRLRYSLKGNLNLERGSLSLWYKPEWRKAFVRTSDPRQWRTLFSVNRPPKRLGTGAVFLWCHGDFLRADISDDRDAYIDGIQLVPGGWYHLVLVWENGRSVLYVNGKRHEQMLPSICPLKIVSGDPHPEKRTDRIHSFFVGSYNGQWANGVIDELTIHSEPLSEEKILAEKRKVLPLSLELSHHYGYPGPFRFLLKNEGGTEISAEWSLIAENGSPVPGVNGSFPLRAGEERCVERTLSLSPGRYFLEAKDSSGVPVRQEYWILRETNSHLAKGPMKTILLERIDPLEIRSNPDRFAAKGTLREGRLGKRRYLEAGGGRCNRFAIRFSVPDPEGLYWIEYDYPDDRRRTAEVLVQNCRKNSYELQSGYCTGDEYENSGRILTSGNLFFASGKDNAILVMTARADAPAAISEIRIHQISGGLPDRLRNTPERGDTETRNVGIYYEDPALNLGFGIDPRMMPGLEQMLQRLCAYMKFSAQNLLVYPVCFYSGLVESHDSSRGHAPDFLDALLTVFDREGLSFMGSLNQNNLLSFDHRKLTEANVASGVLHRTPLSILNTGKPNLGGWHGTPPNFNVLHPEVQREVRENVKKILAVGKRHRSFKGIVLHIARHSLLSLGDLKAGYNDFMIEQFEKDTGIRVPADRNDPLRGKEYYRFLTGPVKKEWIRWRCGEVAKFYRKLAGQITAERSDLKLVINTLIPMGEVESPDYCRKDFVASRVLEAGIDREMLRSPSILLQQSLYPADYRWRAGRTLRKGVYEHLRTIDQQREFYFQLEGAVHPWVHMHDRYWESAVGDATKKKHWSDKPDPLKADWLKEQSWRVSTLNPAGFHAMRHYLVPFRYFDVATITKGGFLIGTYGMEEYLVPFSNALRSLPNEVFCDVPSGSDGVRVRMWKGKGKTWFYAVNSSGRPAGVRIRTGKASEITDTVSGAKKRIPESGFSLRLEPYSLRTFRTEGECGISAETEGIP